MATHTSHLLASKAVSYLTGDGGRVCLWKSIYNKYALQLMLWLT